jgi:hypothetical protein
MIDRVCILYWIHTGKNEFKTDYVQHKAVGSTSISLEGDKDCVTASGSKSSAHRQDSKLALLESSKSEDSSSNSQDKLLVCCKGDPLIPTAEEINRAYLKSLRSLADSR